MAVRHRRVIGFLILILWILQPGCKKTQMWVKPLNGKEIQPKTDSVPTIVLPISIKVSDTVDIEKIEVLVDSNKWGASLSLYDAQHNRICNPAIGYKKIILKCAERVFYPQHQNSARYELNVHASVKWRSIQIVSISARDVDTGKPVRIILPSKGLRWVNPNISKLDKIIRPQ